MSLGRWKVWWVEDEFGEVYGEFESHLQMFGQAVDEGKLLVVFCSFWLDKELMKCIAAVVYLVAKTLLPSY
jgi:hypothetical protein